MSYTLRRLAMLKSYITYITSRKKENCDREKKMVVVQEVKFFQQRAFGFNGIMN